MEQKMNPIYNNIELTKQLDKSNCITHSGKFHVDDVISTIFLSKILEKVTLIRLPSVNNIDVKNKIVYDIGLGEFDHHQKNRNGQRKNGIYYSSIGLLWKKFGKKYLEDLHIKYIDKTFDYIDTELIQYIDATDNIQLEYLKNKTSPDFIKLCNPEWNENISEDEAFINAIQLANSFWNIYIKHAIAEVEAIEIIMSKLNNCTQNYFFFDKEMPYKKAMKLSTNATVKYLIFKSRREGYDIRIVANSLMFKPELIKSDDISVTQKITGIDDLIYADVNGKFCCTKTLESAIKLISYNES
jgi:uncharacterized UPF0160 family protein